MEVDVDHALIEKKEKATPSMTVLKHRGWQELISLINDKINVINVEMTNIWNFLELFVHQHHTLFQNNNGEDFFYFWGCTS